MFVSKHDNFIRYVKNALQKILRAYETDCKKKLLMLKYNRNTLIVVRAKLYNLLERKMIKKIIEFFKKQSIRLILPIIGIVFIIVSSILFCGTETQIEINL